MIAGGSPIKGEDVHSLLTTDSTRPRLAFRLPLDPARLLRARQRIRDYLHEHGVDPELIEDIVLVTEEAMTNAVRHSGAHDDLEVCVGFEQGDLVVDVRDRGSGFDVEGFDPSRQPGPLEPCGRGLYLIARLMDQVDLRTGDGLEVRAVKRDVLAEPRQPAVSPDLGFTVPGARVHHDARQRALLDEIDEAFLAFEWEYRLVHMNEAAVRLLGVSPEELLGSTFRELFSSEEGDPATDAVVQAMQLGKPAIVEHESTTVAGRCLELRTYPTSFGVSVFARDIAERRRMEREHEELFEALRESEDRYRRLFENMAEEVHFWQVVRDEHGEITTWRLVDANPSALESWGRSSLDEIEGKTTEEIFGPGATEHYMPVVQKIMREGVPHSFEDYFANLDKHFRFTSVPLGDHFITTGADITGSKHAEETLRQTLESIPGMVFTTRPDGYCDYQSQQWEDYTGVPMSEHLGDGWNRLLHPDDRALAMEAWGGATGGRSPYDLEYRVRRHDGVYEWFKVIGRPIHDASGRVIRWFGVAMNIEALKRAEQALRESDERFRTAVKHSSFIPSQFDRELRYRWIYNPHPDFDPSEVIGKRDDELNDSESGRRLAALKRQVIESGEGVHAELSFEMSDGAHTYDFTIEPLRDADGAITGATSASFDITERKLLETRLQEEQLRVRLATEAAEIGIYDYDVGSGILDGDERVGRLWGVGVDEFITLEAFMAGVHPDDRDRVREAMERALDPEGGGRVTVEFRAPSPAEATERWFMATGQAVFAGGRPVRLIGTLADVSDQKQREAELHSLYETQRDISLELQRGLLHELPVLRGFEVGLVEAPAQEPGLVGGDFWELFELPDGRVVAIVGDVAGKGIPAAGMTRTVRSALHALAQVDADPRFLLAKTNDLLCAHAVREDLFVTALVLVVDAGRGEVQMASAGHPGPIVLSDGACSAIEPDYGLPMGAFPATAYSTSRFEIAAGDCLVLYTDGVVEARRGDELFGERRLIETLEGLRARPAPEVARAVREAAEGFAGSLHDDLEVMALRLKQQR